MMKLFCNEGVCVCVRFCARRNGDDDDDDGGGERVELLLWIHVVGWTVALHPDSLSKLSFLKWVMVS